MALKKKKFFLTFLACIVAAKKLVCSLHVVL